MFINEPLDSLSNCARYNKNPASQRKKQLTMLKDRIYYLPRRTFLSFGSRTSSERSFRVAKKVNVPPSLIFQVVADVLKYQEFVPFVTHSFISKRSEETTLPSEAGFRVGWNQYDEKFTCNLSCIKNKQVIAESVTVLLFNNLYNEWNFKEVKNRFTNELDTYVELVLKYKFKNPLYNTMCSLFQKQVSETMIEAFESRAMQLKINEKLKDRIN